MLVQLQRVEAEAERELHAATAHHRAASEAVKTAAATLLQAGERGRLARVAHARLDLAAAKLQAFLRSRAVRLSLAVSARRKSELYQQDACWTENQRVRICSLAKRPELNGALGHVFLPGAALANDRVGVFLDSGLKLSVKCSNLEFAGSAAVQRWQRDFMVEDGLGHAAFNTSCFCSLQDEARYDAVACAVAMVQALPPNVMRIPDAAFAEVLRATSQPLMYSDVAGINDEEGRCLWLGEGDNIECDARDLCMKLLAFNRSAGSRDPNEATCPVCLEELLSADGFVTLACGHNLHSTCLEQVRSHAPKCPMCRQPIPQQILTVSIEVPSNWEPSTTFNFIQSTSRSNRNDNLWNLRPRQGTKPGDLMTVSLDAGSEDVLYPPRSGVSLDIALNKVMALQGRGKEHCLMHVVECSQCCLDEGWSVRPDGYLLRGRATFHIRSTAARTIEELLFEVHCPAHRNVCPLCMHNRVIGGWCYDGNRDCWFKTLSDTVPKVAFVTLPMLSLPSVLFFEFSTTRFSRSRGPLTYFPQVCGGTSLGHAARYNLPHLWLAQVTVRANLDVRAYFSSACPPPTSAPTLYALCWLLELHPANSTRACERAAAKGPLPQFEARYRSYTKSAFDGRWRLVDVCDRDKRVALFGPDDKQSYMSRWIRCLLYCRLHGPLQAQRPHF